MWVWVWLRVGVVCTHAGMCALFLVQNWFVVGFITRICKAKKRMGDSAISRHDAESIIHVRLAHIRKASGAQGGGLEVEVDEGEMYAHPSQFVSRVFVVSACAPLADKVCTHACARTHTQHTHTHK